MSAESRPKGLNILCIDGGGVRGLSSLILLSEIMKRLQSIEGTDTPLNPIDYFDVIAGTGTGGVIACMLGRLRMTLDEAIKAYAKLVEDVFSEKKGISTTSGATYKGTKLREGLKAIVRGATGSEAERIREGGLDGGECTTMIFAMSKYNLNAGMPVTFRSYGAATTSSPDCTIWEALYATMAHPNLFKAIDIIDGSLRQTFVGGEVGCSNPIAHVLTETRKMYPGRHVSCVLSIGAGHARTIHIPDPSPISRMLRMEEVVAMKDMATDSERVAEEMAARFQDTTGVYYRFNVDQGMQSMETGEWERLSEVVSHTRAYIQRVDTNRGIDQAARAIKERKEAFTIAYLGGRIQLPAAKQAITIKRCPAPTSAYTGRKDQIHQVGTCISGGIDERRVCVVYGLGGAGKTQLALKTIEEKRDSWKHIIYVDASSKETVEGALGDFARAKSIGETYHDALTWLETCCESWLVVFDNADDPATSIHEYFPGSDHGSILITSRLPDLQMHARGPGSVCHISSMSQEDALQLLLRLARKRDQELNETEMESASALLQDFGNLALATVHAGAYIGHSNMSISEYRKLFLIRRQPTLERYEKMKVKIDDYKKSVYTTWKMCYDQLPEEGISRPLLWLMAYLHHKYITTDIFERAVIGIRSYEPLIPRTSVEEAANEYLRDYFGRFREPNGEWDSHMFLDAVNELASYSLIEFDRANVAYNVHVLVQEWTRTIIPQSQELALECATALLAGSVVIDSSAESCQARVRLALHVNRVLLACDFKPSTNHAVRFAAVYEAQGRWEMKELLEHQVLDARKRVLGEEHPHTLTSMNNLASTYHSQGRWDKAESIHLQVLDARKRVLGEEHPHTLSSMNNLTTTYQNQGRWDKAESIQLQVLDAQKRVLGEEHPHTLSSMNNLAGTYHGQGRWDKAESIQLQVLDAQKRVLGEEHPDTMRSVHNLAGTYQNQGRWDNAESMQLQVLDAQKPVLGEEHPHTLTSMNNLAMTYHSQGRWDKAESIQLQVLDARKRVLGEEHPDTLTTMNNLAVTYQSQGRWDKAESVQLQVLDAQQRVLGEEHPHTLRSLNNLASTYWDQGRWDKAESIQLQVLDARKRVLGEEHPHTLTSMNNLGMTYQNQGRWDKAESIQLQVLDAQKPVLGEEHPNTLRSMNNLAMIYQNQDRWDKAESIQLQVLDAQKRVLGEGHSDTLTSMNNLAGTYQNQGRWDKAESIQLQVLDARKRVLGEEHPHTLSSMNNLAMTYQNQGRWDKAESMQLQVLDARKRILGEEHPDTLRTMSTLASIYQGQGRWDAKESVLVLLVDAQGRVFGHQHPNVLQTRQDLELTRSNKDAAARAANTLDGCDDAITEK